MRLWTIHPQYLDTKGLLAAWREGLLAQKVLRGQTRGYTRHPQLRRFQERRAPVKTIACYLTAVANEADHRGYRFDRSKISIRARGEKLIETRGQLLFEWSHLKRKLRRRAPKDYRICCKIGIPRAHPLFRIVAGPIREWEKANRAASKAYRARHGKRNSSSRS
jgi:hypothetical protein